MKNETPKEKPRRTTLDLLKEFRKECNAHRDTYLLIGHDQHSEFISPRFSDHVAMERINAAVTKGGRPLGFVWFNTDCTTDYRVLEDHQGEAVTIARCCLLDACIRLRTEYLELRASN